MDECCHTEADSSDGDYPGNGGIGRRDVSVTITPDRRIMAASYGCGGGAGCWHKREA
jgi:hypothetical protein